MKVLLINGSPHEKGNTYSALSFVAGALEEEGVEAEILNIPNDPISGCQDCGACEAAGRNRCIRFNDIVNVILEKMENSDAIVLGSPVYYASPNGHLLSALDRAFYAGGSLFKGKPGSAICVARRGGATAALDALQKYFPISGMPMAPSTYWPMAHGLVAGDVEKDGEGVQCMQMVGKTVAWLIKCIAAGKSAGILYPELPGGEAIYTNFIR